MLGTLTLASNGSLVVTLLLEVASRIFVVEGFAVPCPWFRTVKVTLTVDPAAPLDGLTVRACPMRSAIGGEIVNDRLVLSFASLAVPWPAVLPASRITHM